MSARLRRVAALVVVAALTVGCRPPPPPQPTTATSGTASATVTYARGNPPTWAYAVTDPATFNRLSFDLAVACPKPTITVAPATVGATFVPATGPSRSWVIIYPAGSAPTSDTVTFACDAADQGVASIRVLTVTGSAAAGPTLTPLDGPK